METRQERHAARLLNWRQTAERRIVTPDDAANLIDELGLVTLFPVSPEVPNLFQAYMGDPTTKTDSGHDSPSGEVYGWRWVLGRREAGFYTAIVRNRPTWVSWRLLPAVLRVRGEVRPPDELFAAGVLSSDALRIAGALRGAAGVLSTGELRRAAGFPPGKEQRAAYLKAVQELDSRLLLAKVFSPDDLEMRHAIVAIRYAENVTAANALTYEAALAQILRTYLGHAVYVVPNVLAKHLGVPADADRQAIDALGVRHLVEPRPPKD
jgi:hypothetical protein